MTADTGSAAPTENPAITRLEERRRIWGEKYPIRACYENWCRMLAPWIIPGRTLEVGGGAGLMKEIWRGELVSTDILATPWIDFDMDAQAMSVGEASFENILCMDAVHHFPDPHLFFRNAAHVLKDGGRILMIEPWITPVSRFYYWLLHHESVNFGGYHPPTDGAKDPWQGNMAIPTLIFERERARWEELHPELRIVRLERFSFFDFQFAGGFKRWAVIRNKGMYDLLLRMDRRLSFLMGLIAFRAMIIIERAPRSS